MSKLIGKEIIGTWELVYWKCIDEDKKTTHFFGKKAKGILMYDKAGNMNAQIFRGGRKNFKDASFMKGKKQEQQNAYASYISYYGKYIERTPGELVHAVEGSLFPNWKGQEMIRYGKIKKEHLYLSAPLVQIGSKKILFKVKWKKVC